MPVAEGVELNANVWAGDGVPFLLVHGLASNARLWDGVAEELAGAGHRVVAIDQRGHGLSSKVDEGYDFPTLVSDLVSLIAFFGLDRPVVAGQSWGANVVLELGTRRPDLVRGVVFVDGASSELQRPFPTWEACAAALAPPRSTGAPLSQIEGFMRARHAGWPETGIQGALACFEHRVDGTIAPWLTFDRHMTILRHLWEHKPTEVYASVSVPVLLVPCDSGQGGWAANKRAGVEHAERVLPRSRTMWFEADHDVHAQYPEQVAALFRECTIDGTFT